MPSPLVFSESIVGPISANWTGFRCTLRQSDRDAAWVRVTGELDIATAPQLQQTLREARHRARRVVLDLRELTFMDCVGMRVILDASTYARQAGGQLALVRGPSRVDRLFTLTGASDALEIVDLDAVAPPVQALVKLAQHAAA
jgi:anti-anti-sigma factor